MSKPHPHRDLIIAWANGAEIECGGYDGAQWALVPVPAWVPNLLYRIKPQPRPDLVRYAWLSPGLCNTYWMEEFDGDDNVKATWKDVDGEYVLHSIEVIK